MVDLSSTRPTSRSVGGVTVFAIVAAPVSLVGGWLVAGAVQSDHYSPVRQTISALAAHGAADRWIMTTALYLVGAFQLVGAVGFPTRQRGPRLVLAIVGVASLGVAVFPQPAHGSSAAHIACASVSIGLLALWPATLYAGAPEHPRVLNAGASLITTSCFLALLAWLLVAGHGGGAIGVAERVVTTVENLWPVVVVTAIRRQQSR